MNDLGKKVKELRAGKGLTQQQLAENSGLSLRTIQRIELGESVPRGYSLEQLGKTLDTNFAINRPEHKESKSALLQLSQLSYLALPFLGFLIPLVISKFIDQEKGDFKSILNTIVNFQLTWFALLCITNITAIVLKLNNLPYSNDLLYVGIIFYFYNGLFIIGNTISTAIGYRPYYLPSLKFFK